MIPFSPFDTVLYFRSSEKCTHCYCCHHHRPCRGCFSLILTSLTFFAPVVFSPCQSRRFFPHSSSCIVNQYDPFTGVFRVSHHPVPVTVPETDIVDTSGCITSYMHSAFVGCLSVSFVTITVRFLLFFTVIISMSASSIAY